MKHHIHPCELEFLELIRHSVLKKVNFCYETGQFPGQTTQIQLCVRQLFCKERFGYVSPTCIGSLTTRYHGIK